MFRKRFNILTRPGLNALFWFKRSATEKKTENSKKDQKIVLLSLYLQVLYHVWKSRGGTTASLPSVCRHPCSQAPGIYGKMVNRMFHMFSFNYDFYLIAVAVEFRYCYCFFFQI